MAKDAFLGGTLDRIADLSRESLDAATLRTDTIALDEAAARIAEAIDLTDHTRSQRPSVTTAGTCVR